MTPLTCTLYATIQTLGMAADAFVELDAATWTTCGALRRDLASAFKLRDVPACDNEGATTAVAVQCDSIWCVEA